jgi:hypothetical protein
MVKKKGVTDGISTFERTLVIGSSDAAFALKRYDAMVKEGLKPFLNSKFLKQDEPWKCQCQRSYGRASFACRS